MGQYGAFTTLLRYISAIDNLVVTVITMLPSLKRCWQFLIAAILTFIVASITHSQFVLAELVNIGVEISMASRLSMTIDDMFGLFPTYGSIITISLLVAFSLCALFAKRYEVAARIMYPLSGAIGIGTALLAMHPILDISLIAGARSDLGFISQCLTGAFGGWLYYVICSRNTCSEK